MVTRKLPREKTRGVTHLTTVHPPFDVRIFHKECKSIARAGYDVTLIACHDRDEMREGVRIHAIPKAHGRLSRMIWGVWAVYREAVRQDADLYHFHDPELIPVGLVMRLKGKKVVYDVHEDVSADVALKHYIPQPFRGPAAWIVSLMETAAAKFFSAVIPATPWIARRFGPRTDNVVVVSNYPVIDGPQLEARRPWPQRSAAVAYVGLLARDRCISEMVRAMTLLPKNLGGTLRLAGTFSSEDFQRELAGINGWDRADFLGNLIPTQVAGLLEDVRAGLLIYRPDPNNVQAAPNKLFEYMCAGIPVIASDFPSFREIIEDVKCGLLVNPLDPHAIARAIEYVFNHPAAAEQMGLRGREAVRSRYNWPSQERKLLNLYRKLLDSACAA
jgi:glycosyltransferase involved in cell wall biosynthesis